MLPAIKAQGQKMEHNIKNLVSHFSEFSPKFAKAQLNQLVEKEIFAALKDHVVTARLVSGIKDIGKNLKLSKNLSVDLPLVKIDNTAFSTIASNVFINALIGLGEKGGEVKVVTRIKPKSDKIVELIIFDSGSGIPANVQTKLFEPFNGKKTLGLGLSVVKKLLTELGGEISIKSVPGKSTMVTMEFPIIK